MFRRTNGHFELASSPTQGVVTPDSFTPDPGDCQIVFVSSENPTIYDDKSTAGVFVDIASNVLSIATYFMTTAGSIITDIANALGVTIYESGGSTAKTQHSYGTWEKRAQIWTYGGVWNTYYTAISRPWYGYAWASFLDSNGQTHPGYDPYHYHENVHTDFSPNYQNDTYLCQIAYSIWATSGNPSWESY